MKILVIRLSSLGDIILTQPIVQQIKKLYPQAEVCYLTKKAYLSAIESFGVVDRVLLWEKNILSRIRRERFDLVLDLQNKLNSRLATLFCKKVVRYRKKAILRRLITKKLTHKRINTTLDLYNSVFRQLKKEPTKAYPVLIPQAKEQKKAFEIFAEAGVNFKKTLIGIFPGAAHATKTYPFNYWRKFVDLVDISWNCQFILLGDYTEKETCVKLAAGQKTVDLCGRFDIGELIGAVSQLQMVLSGDTGPMHVAAALRIPQMAIFGSTHTKLGFRPLNDSAYILETELTCRPCSPHGLATCPKGHFKCMKMLTPDLLLAQFKKILEQKVWKLT